MALRLNERCEEALLVKNDLALSLKRLCELAAQRAHEARLSAEENDQTADHFAQCLTCGCVALKLLRRANPGALDNALQFLRNSCLSEQLIERLEQGLSVEWPDLSSCLDAIVGETDVAEAGPQIIIDFYEGFLAAYNPQKRKRRGVYYTPQPLVSFVVNSVDRYLQHEFGFETGLAEATILDPAMGTGRFLLGAIDCIREAMFTRWKGAGCTSEEVGSNWQTFVADQLLPNLYGFELMPAPLLLAHVQIAAHLAESGFRARPQDRLQLFQTNTLDPQPLPTPLTQGSEQTQRELADLKHKGGFDVIIGNPPFSGVSSNMNEWIDGLLKQPLTPESNEAGYFSVDGQPLGERKHWLQDDYVKFFRYSQAKVDQAGRGIVALVTNHGYLDNPTFRGMRQSLLATFPTMTLIDLHGNVKKKERGPNGHRDQGVFLAEQGIAVGFLRRSDSNGEQEVRRGDVWGSRADKLTLLAGSTAQEVARQKIVPKSPDYLLEYRDETHLAEYEKGWRICDIMIEGSTAPVTARDGFVVALTGEELCGRLEEFRDLSISDEQIREKYFQNTRSAKYPAGDTRGFKLPAARRSLNQREQWRDAVQSCQYRPFDRRAIYWDSDMVDWPRPEVSKAVMTPGNFALVVRRQMPPSQPCNYFWASELLVLDGVIRSDNRGSESVYPVHRVEEGELRGNFCGEFVRAVEEAWGLSWINQGRGDPVKTVGPEDIAAYVYALFHATEYRTRYATFLRSDFPRVLLTRNSDVRDCLRREGCRLLDAHFLRVEGEVSQFDSGDVDYRYPRHDGEQVLINQKQVLATVCEEVWEYRVGTRQPCRDWLVARRGRTLLPDDVQHYGKIVAAIRQTLECVKAIDRVTVLSEFGV